MERLNSAGGHCPLAGDARAQRGVPVGLSGLGEPDVGVDGDLEGVGDLDEAGEADAGVVGGFVALDGLFGEADAFGELALGEPSGDSGPDEGDGELVEPGGFDEGGGVEGLVFGQFGFEVGEGGAERLDLQLAHGGIESVGQLGVGELGDGGAGLVGSAAGDAVLPLVFDHGSQASRSMTTIPFGSPLRSCWKNSTKNMPEPASRMFGKNSQPNSAFLSRAAG